MTAPNMATITESLERSLQNCSLNNHERTHNRNSSSSSSGSGGGGGGGAAADQGRIIGGRSTLTSEQQYNNLPNTVSDTSLELNSHLSLPYHWEQCLDLKTGEIYYINWRNGMKAREDPRSTAAEYSGDYYSEEEDDDDDDEDEEEAEDDSSYDSEESSSESFPSCSRERDQYYNKNNSSNKNNKNNNHQRVVEKDKDNVLVVAGCKSCLMYFMVPKQVEDCPKCNGQLLHFDRSESSSP